MKVTVYCGASEGNRSIYAEAARELGIWIAQNGHSLTYGGGKVGLMGILADTVLVNGGEVTGIIPEFLKAREIAHGQLNHLQVVADMPTRKQALMEKADLFIALPGGPGTLEEISEVISWTRIGQNSKPCVLLNIGNYYTPLELMFQSMVENGFLSQEDFAKILFATNLEQIENFVRNYEEPEIRQY